MTARFRDVGEVKAWNDAMVATYDLDRFHDHPSPFVRFVESRRVAWIFALLGARSPLVQGDAGALPLTVTRVVGVPARALALRWVIRCEARP